MTKKTDFYTKVTEITNSWIITTDFDTKITKNNNKILNVGNLVKNTFYHIVKNTEFVASITETGNKYQMLLISLWKRHI